MNNNHKKCERIISTKTTRSLTEEKEVLKKVTNIKDEAIEKIAISLLRKEYEGTILSVERETSLNGIDPTGFTLGVTHQITEEIELELDDSTKVIIIKKS